MEVQEKQQKLSKNLALAGDHMYKFERYRQLGLADFNQPAGLKMDPENCWIRKVSAIPWEAIEENMHSFFRVIQVCLPSLCEQHWDPW